MPIETTQTMKNIRRTKTKRRESRDNGTVELQYKRLQQITLDPLDLCLQRGLITPEQHEAGIRLRWLYTQRYGVPTISASSRIYGVFTEKSNPNHCIWEQAEYEAEYKAAIHLLRKEKLYKLVTDISIFGIFPEFLINSPSNTMKGIATLTDNRRRELLKQLRKGLNHVLALWRMRRNEEDNETAKEQRVLHVTCTTPNRGRGILSL